MKRLFLASLLLITVNLYSQDIADKHLIKFLSTNSNHSDYAVSFYGDNKLVFSTPLEEDSKRPKHDLFIADVKTSGQIGDKTNIGFDNSTVTKTGLSLNRKRDVVYFSAKNKRKGKHQLFRANIDDNGLWTKIVRLPFNQNKYHYTSPVLSVDNKKLYFVSDNRDSYGGTDIFQVDILDDGTYSQPKNLGKAINTTGNEVTPFISNKNILFFASDGRAAGKGGLDIYKSDINDNTFTNPTPLDAPINGANNDFGYIINSESSKGYFSSNRLQGDENNNLYSFLIDVPKPVVCEQIIAGIVKDNETKEILVGAKMTLIDKDQNEVQQILTDDNGAYSITMLCNETFTLIASNEGYNRDEHIINTANYIEAPALSANKFLTKDPNYDPIQATNDELIANNNSGKDKITDDELASEVNRSVPDINAIYFDFDKSYIKQTARPQLDEVAEFMDENPNYKIELSAYTDSRGPQSYNLLLSQRRVKSTMKYLNNKGIDKDRISGEGFGEANITNGCVDGVPCSRVKHRKNRRTEFRFISDNVVVTNESWKKTIEKKETTLKLSEKKPAQEVEIAKTAIVKSDEKTEKLPETKMPELKMVVSNQAEFDELVEKGIIVEQTTIIKDDTVKPKTVKKTESENVETISKADDTQSISEKPAIIPSETISPTEKKTTVVKEVVKEKEKLTSDTSNLINIRAISGNNDEYDRMIRKGVIKEEEQKSSELVHQSQTSKETFDKLEELRKNKEEQLKKENAVKTLPLVKKEIEKAKPYSEVVKTTTEESEDSFDPNAMLAKAKANATENPAIEVKKEEEEPAKVESAANLPDISVSTFTITPMTSKRGKYMATNKAKKIQALRVIFNVANNEDDLEGYHDAYIVVKSPQGKIINQQGTFELFNGEEMGFTDQTTLFFNSDNIKVVMFIDRIIQKFVKGNYLVDIYVNGQKSASSNMAISS